MRIGARLPALLLLACFSLGGSGWQSRQSGQAAFALVVGTVFREPGFALPRAEVALSVQVPPEGMKPPKARKTSSDGRGEFSFRVPAAKARYLLSVRADGFAGQEKIVDVNADERVDVYFELKALSR